MPLNVPVIREARLDECGEVIGAISHHGDGLLRLVIQIEPDVLGTVAGLGAIIQEVVHHHKYQKVQVVENAHGSRYGFHDVRPLEVKAVPVAKSDDNPTIKRKGDR